MLRILFITSCFILACTSSCKYSFKGTSIDPDAETFNVEEFDLRVINAPPTLGQDFSNELIEKIQRESRLNLDDTDPDLYFEGAVNSFEVTAPSPEAGERTAFNRLNVSVLVDYYEAKKDEKTWSQTFSYFFDFPTDQNLLDVQEEALENIYLQLVEDVFNKAFTNW